MELPGTGENVKKSTRIIWGCVGGLFTFLVIISVLYMLWDRFARPRPQQLPRHWQEFSEWTYEGPDGKKETVTMPCNLATPEGETVSLVAQLPSDIEAEDWISIETASDFRLYIDGELRKEFSSADANVSGGMVKPVYVFCEVDSRDNGKEIRIDYCSPDRKNGRCNRCFIGDKLGLVARVLSEGAVLYICMMLLATISLIIVIGGAVNKIRTKADIPLVMMALGTLLGAAWLAFRSDMFQFVFQNYYIDGTMAYIGILLVPYPFIRYANSMQKRRQETFLQILAIIAGLNSFVFTALHFMNIADFQQMRPYLGTVLGVIAAGVAVTIVYDIVKGHFAEYRLVAIGFSLFLLFALLEIITGNLVVGTTEGSHLIIGLYCILIFAIMQQMSEMRKVEKQSQLAVAANEAKTMFLANMSHEIRTPINSVIGMNEMILRESTEPQIREYAEQVERSGRLLLGLVNDVLDFSKIESGRMEITEVRYSTAQMLVDVINVLKERASAKDLDVRVSVSPSLPAEMIGDDVHIREILINLFSNAVKYTRKGTVTFGVEGFFPEDDSGFKVKFSVSDTGIGISRDNIETLFDSFNRGSADSNRAIEGTGLGLAIVKRLCTGMKGTVSVRSVEGQGSTFTVIIPQGISGKETVGNLNDAIKKCGTHNGYTESFTAPEARILVVDDTPANLVVVKQLLKKTLMEIDTATGGNEAIRLCRRKRYDLIFMDHRMPELDGIESFKIIRDDENGFNRETPVVVLTANAYAGLREQYMAEGFRDYLSKPIDPAQMEACIMGILPAGLISPASKSDEVRTEAESPQPEVNSPLEELRSMPGMDYEKTRLTYKADDGFMIDFLSTVVISSHEKLDIMRKALAEHDYERFGIEAHGMKSSFASFFAMEISEHAKKHEFAAKESRFDFIDEDGSGLIEEIAAFIDRIEKALQKIKK